MKRIAVFLVVVILLIGMHAYAFAAYGPDDLTALSVSSYMKQREIKLSRGLVDVQLQGKRRQYG